MKLALKTTMSPSPNSKLLALLTTIKSPARNAGTMESLPTARTGEGVPAT